MRRKQICCAFPLPQQVCKSPIEMDLSSAWKKLVDNISRILLSLTLRLALLRIVCWTTFNVFVIYLVGQNWDDFWTYYYIFIFVHHLAIVLSPRFSLHGGLELVLVGVEGSLQFMNTDITTVSTSDGQSDVFLATMAWISALALLLLFFVRIAQAVETGREFLWKHYDIAGPKMKHLWSPSKESKENLSPYNVLFGRSIWKPQLPGEAYWIAIVRGIFVALFIVLLAMSGFYFVVIEPVWETGVTPVKDSRFYDTPTGLLTTPSQDGRDPWNIVVGRPIYSRKEGSASILSAIKVTVIQSDTNTSDCHNIYDGIIKDTPASFQFVTFQCPDDAIDDQKDRDLDLSLFYPDILVTVNFTMLNITSNSIGTTKRDSVHVILGRTNNTLDIVQMMSPTFLIPGVNLVGFLRYQLRQQFSEKVPISAFGLAEPYRTLYIAGIADVIQEPRTSSLISRSPEVSTLRIVSPHDFSEWVLIQQNRDKSVIKGFATVGGLWTFFGGIFATLFGCSILSITIGLKPVSPFGITHSFQKDVIWKACEVKYPQLTAELNDTSKGKWGVLAFLADYVIDLGLFAEHVAQNNAGHAVVGDAQENISLTARHSESEVSV